MEALTQQLCPSCLDLLELKERDVHFLLVAAAWAGLQGAKVLKRKRRKADYSPKTN